MGHVCQEAGSASATLLATGNVVEVQMYATMGGQFMRMHPVIIMVPKLQTDA